jgi:glycosyltransferase involved in cell wall biosynthesis
VLTRFLVPDAFLLSWAPMALRAAWAALRERPADCVITSSPNESTHLVGLALRRRFGHAWIADLRDGWTFERFLPDFPTRAQRSLNAALERAVVRRADAVTAATRPIADDLRRRHGVPVEHVPNAWDPDLEPPPPEPPRNGHVRLVHTGMLSGAWGRDPGALFAALRRLLDEEPELQERLRVVVAGTLSESDERSIAREGLDGVVSSVGYVPRSEALQLQRGADALLLVTSRHAGEATGKVFEYLAAGRPIVALAAGNEAARIVEETGTGVAVDPADPEAVLGALRSAVRGELRYEPHGLEDYRQPAPALRIAEIAGRAV